MNLRRLLPPADGDALVDLDHPDVDRLLAEAYDPGGSTWLRLNMVASVTGSIAGQDGTSNSLTNRVDRRLLGVIRALADVVLVGAESVRAEGYRVPRSTPLAIVTGSGDLSGHRLGDDDAQRVLVLCPASAVDAVRRSTGAGAEIVVVDDDDGRMPPARLIGALRDRGMASVVCEGGARLAAQLMAADLVDEMCLTTAPLIAASTVPIFGGESLPERRLTLTHLMTDDASTLFGRWAVVRDG